MGNGGDWWVWPLAIVLVLLFLAFFVLTGRELFRRLLHVAAFIENWPQYRRQLVEEEARAGGRHPWWYRALRVFFILAAIALAAYIIWRLVG